jgi:hypothetical protein
MQVIVTQEWLYCAQKKKCILYNNMKVGLPRYYEVWPLRCSFIKKIEDTFCTELRCRMRLVWSVLLLCVWHSVFIQHALQSFTNSCSASVFVALRLHPARFTKFHEQYSL